MSDTSVESVEVTNNGKVKKRLIIVGVVCSFILAFVLLSFSLIFEDIYGWFPRDDRGNIFILHDPNPILNSMRIEEALRLTRFPPENIMRTASDETIIVVGEFYARLLFEWRRPASGISFPVDIAIVVGKVAVAWAVGLYFVMKNWRYRLMGLVATTALGIYTAGYLIYMLGFELGLARGLGFVHIIMALATVALAMYYNKVSRPLDWDKALQAAPVSLVIDKGVPCACGHVYPVGGKFCGNCGEKTQQLVCSCGVGYKQGEKFCGSCGKKIDIAEVCDV